MIKFSDARTPGRAEEVLGWLRELSVMQVWLVGGLAGCLVGWMVGLRDIADASQEGRGCLLCPLLHKARQDISCYRDPINGGDMSNLNASLSSSS